MRIEETEIVFNLVRLLESFPIQGGQGRETMEITGELIQQRGGWLFFAAVHYKIEGIGAVIVMMPEYTDRRGAAFAFQSRREDAVHLSICSALRLAEHLDRNPAQLQALRVEGRHKLFCSIGVRLPGRPGGFSD